MKSTMVLGLSVFLTVCMIAGCTDKVEETLDPNLKLTVHEAVAMFTSPAPSSRNATDGKEFLYVKINITNNNEKTDHTVFNADRFSVDDNDATSFEGSFIANLDMREMNSLVIDHGAGKTFYVVFEVAEDLDMKYLRYEPGIDEPLDAEIPEYDHFSEKI